MNDCLWRVRIWDGNSNWEVIRKGSYDQVRNSLAALPPSYIWSIQ